MDQMEVIKANAELVIQTFPQENLAYDERSVEFIDRYIVRNRKSLDKPTIEKLVSVFGSFLGECIRHNFGGQWEMTENGLAISFDSNNSAFPFNKIEKHFANEDGDSVLGFYQMIPVVFKLK